MNIQLNINNRTAILMVGAILTGWWVLKDPPTSSSGHQFSTTMVTNSYLEFENDLKANFFAQLVLVQLHGTMNMLQFCRLVLFYVGVESGENLPG